MSVQKKILILTAGFGDGHNAAARSLRDAIELSRRGRARGSRSTCSPTATARSTPSPEKATSAWCNTRRDSGAAFIRCWKIRSSKNNSAVSRGCKTRWKKFSHETQPDCVVSTYPVYAPRHPENLPRPSERPFRFITVVTDSITVNSAWFRAPSDLFCVANEATAEVLQERRRRRETNQGLGFPVSPLFAENPNPTCRAPVRREPRRVLYIINTGKKKAGKAIDRLLEIPTTCI